MLRVPKIKMPGPKGIITITGNRKKAEECFQKGSRSPMLRWWQKSGRNTKGMQTRVICCEPKSLLRNQCSSRPVRQNPFTSTRPTQTLLRLISPQHSTSNRKKRSSSSSVRTGTSLHGNLLTCRVYPGDWLSIVYESIQRQNL